MDYQDVAPRDHSPSKRVVAGSNPAGVANQNSSLYQSLLDISATPSDATRREQTRTTGGARHEHVTDVLPRFSFVLLHLDRTIRELRRIVGEDLASLALLEIVRRDLIEKDHPECAGCEHSYFCKV